MYPPRFLRQSRRFLIREPRFNFKIPFSIASVFVGVCLGTLTLPAKPLEEWTWTDPELLEGSSTDVAYGNEVYVVLGRFGSINISTDQGRSWDAHFNLEVDGRIYSQIRFLNGRFFAVGEQDGDALISSSIDAITWSHTTIPDIGHVAGIAYGNGIYTTSRTPLISTDGENWTEVTRTGAFYSVDDIVFANGRFVGSSLITQNAYDIIASEDGVNWESIGQTAAMGVISLAAGNDVMVSIEGTGMRVLTDEGEWIASNYVDFYFQRPADVAFDSANEIFYAAGYAIRSSIDGVDWTEETDLDGWYGSALAIGNNSIVCLGSLGSIWNKQGNEEWIRITGGLSSEDLSDIAFGKLWVDGSHVSRYVATPTVDGRFMDKRIFVSENGKDWERVLPNGNYFGSSAIAFGKNRFVAVGSKTSSSTNSFAIHTSQDGMTFVEHAIEQHGRFQDVAYGENTFVAVGDRKQIYTSTYLEDDGGEWSEWIRRELDSEIPLKTFTGVTYGDGYFITVGSDLPILRSSDGATWQSVTGDTTYDLTSIAFGKSTFVALRSNLLVSIDNGDSWQTLHEPELSSGTKIEFLHGQFLVFTETEKLYVSENGFQWTEKTLPTEYTLSSITVSEDAYYAVGSPGTAILKSSPIEYSFRLGDFRQQADGDIRLQVYAEPESDVLVQASTDLINWKELDTVTIEQYPTSILDTEAIEGKGRFYRAVTEDNETDP